MIVGYARQVRSPKLRVWRLRSGSFVPQDAKRFFGNKCRRLTIETSLKQPSISVVRETNFVRRNWIGFQEVWPICSPLSLD